MILQVFYFVVCLLSIHSASRHCDRRQSRLVSKVVNEKLMPAFKQLGAELSEECQFSPTRSLYHVQESHKSSEESSKWLCHFCGKSFYTEHFLDMHFNNRHADQIQEPDSLCLADVCEVFRCDVIGQDIVPDFWDYALCLEDDMKSLHHRCALMVDSCVPSGLTDNETQWLTDVTTIELCSYLTCSKYWEIPFASTDVDRTTGLYVIMTVIVVLGLLVYYSLFYAYYYTDSFADAVVYDPTPRMKHPIKPFQPVVRHRHRSADSHPE